jgi:predicted transcriptional regulator
MEGWTFLTNHSHVLLSIVSDPEIRLRDIAQSVGITERAAQRIVADLIEGGYLISTKVGRRNRYTVNSDRRLRHPIEQHCRIESLLSLVAGKNEVAEDPSRDEHQSSNGQQKHGQRRPTGTGPSKLRRGRSGRG